MGIDYDGGMIVGRRMKDIEIPQETLDKHNMEQYEYLIEELEMDHLSPWFDSDSEFWVVGFEIKDVECWDRHGMTFRDWLDDLEELSDRFYELTGVKPHLMGAQHIT